MVREQFKVHGYAAMKSRRRAVQRRFGELVTVQVDQEVWKLAKAIAGGDVRRLEVRSATEVVVRNNRVR